MVSMVERISHYRVLDRLGAGAMGEVYLAEDLRLGRRVALKFLPAPLARDETAKSRFFREARAASLLDHPNICTVHDIEETADGPILLAMAYCDGESLKARLDRARGVEAPGAGPPGLPLADVLDVACQVADGLAEAHANGIVHRDIKPANIMLTRSGRVKIVDFGLAHMADVTMTATGTVMGTPAYMAPEQVQGQDVDARADVWGLGVVLYEMLSGQVPFGGETLAARFYNILTGVPEPVECLRPGLPAALAAIVQRALQRNREARYQRVADMLADLRGCRAGEGSIRNGPDGAAQPGARGFGPVSTEAPAPSAVSSLEAAAAPAPAPGAEPGPRAAVAPSVAVLPFVNLSGDKEQEYFCDGMAEELINALGTLDGLRVTSFTSSLRFKTHSLDIRQIGSQLNVESILEGTVRKAGNRVRLTAQLINVADGYHLWSDRYDRQLDDVFALQDEIARAIVGKLKVKLLGAPDAPIVRAATQSVEAYQLYLQGRYHFARRYRGAVDKAVDCFERALALDPRFAAACAGLADCYAVMALWGYRPAAELRARAGQLIDRARSLDDSLAEVHHAIGMIRLYLDWDWPSLEAAFEQALRINPGLAYTRACYATALAVAGERERARAQAEHALSLDPLSPLVITVAAGAWVFFRSFDRARVLLERALELDADFAPAFVSLAQNFGARGLGDEAIQAANRAVEITARHPHFLSVLGSALASAGRRGEATSVLREIDASSRSLYVSPIEWITVVAALGDTGRALDALEAAARDRLPPYPFLFILPAYDSVRRHPRFERILRTFNYTGRWLIEVGATGDQDR